MREDIKDLLTYYTKQPDQLLARKVFGLLGDLPDEDQKRVIEWLLDHVPKKSGLDVPAVRAAMREVGVASPGSEEHPQPWVCDLCGSHFQRVRVSHETLRRQGIHDTCPRCGLAPSDTDLAQSYAKLRNGSTPKWYLDLKRSIAKARLLIPGSPPRYDPKADDAWDERLRRESVERLKKEVQDESVDDILGKLAQAKSMAV